MKNHLRRHTMVEEYLAELEQAAVALPVNRRAELLADVRSHIAVARAEAKSESAAEGEDDADVRRILSQLGDPREIVATALGDLPPGSSDVRTRSRTWDNIAVLLLLFGGILSGIGWIVGVVLLWYSRRWTLADKLLGTFILPGGFLGTAAGTSFVWLAGDQALAIALTIVLLIAPVLVAIHLFRRARRA